MQDIGAGPFGFRVVGLQRRVTLVEKANTCLRVSGGRRWYSEPVQAQALFVRAQSQSTGPLTTTHLET